MINTGNSTSKKILVYDDVNSNNVESIKDAYKKCNLYIDSKFNMPVSSDKLQITVRSKTISSINEKINTISNKLTNGDTSLFSNESQLKNFRTKISYWYTNQFKEVINRLDNNQTDVSVFIDNTPSKHEMIFVRWLAELGISFIIIAKDIDKIDVTDDITVIRLGTSECLDYKSVDRNEVSNDVVSHRSLNDIEQALYEDKKQVRVIINGISNYIDTANFYAKLKNECDKNSNWIFIEKNLDRPSTDDINRIPRFNSSKIDYIIETLSGFVKTCDNELTDSIKNAIKSEFIRSEYSNISGSILYNKMVNVICTLNNLFRDNKYSLIALYGVESAVDRIIVRVLFGLENISVIMLCPNKNNIIKNSGIETIELNSSTEIFEIPSIDTRTNASTLAARAQSVVDNTLFSGDTLGLYKPGQFKECSVKLFDTTFDEIEMWWNKDMYIRPGFEVNNNIPTLPTMFRVISGVKDSNSWYTRYIQKLACGKTLLLKNVGQLRELVDSNKKVNILRGTDINGTKFENQKPFFENGRLRKDRIKDDINFRYHFLSDNKQDLILDKAEILIKTELINNGCFANTQNKIDTILNLILNINTDVLKLIQWFEFYTYNPNVILTLTDETTLALDDYIMLLFMWLLGFDIVIFVPTCYTSIERFVGRDFTYTAETIGEAIYDINISNLSVTSNIEIKEETQKPSGLFGKIFKK